VFGIAISLFYGADFAGVCAAFLPFALILMMIFGVFVKKATFAKITVLKKLGGVIEESLTAIRLISSFANEDKEVKRFDELAEQTRKVAHR
jgi:ABC-type multidrug transport system fused ATPase/permease subunit